jgi:hypothetical protein
LPVCGQGPEGSGFDNRLRPAVHIEFVIDVAGVVLDRVQLEEEPGSNLTVGTSVGDGVENLQFALAQGLDQFRRSRCSGGRGIESDSRQAMTPGRLSGGYSSKSITLANGELNPPVHTVTRVISVFHKREGPLRIREAVPLYLPHYGNWRPRMPPRELQCRRGRQSETTLS